MKPLWLAPSYPSAKDIYAGIWLKTQAQALKKNGISPLVISPVPWVPPGVGLVSPKWKRYADIPYQYNDDGVDVFRPRYFSHPRENAFGAPHYAILGRLLCQRLERPSLIHAHFALPYGWVALQLAKRWDVPLVVSLLGDDVNVYPHVNRASMVRFCDVIRNADAVISQGSALNTKTEEMTGILPKSLPLGIRFDLFNPSQDKHAIRQLLGLPLDQSIALFVGSLFDSKGIPELVRTVEELAAYNLLCIFVGDGPLRGLVEKSSRTIAVGSQNQDVVKQYLAAADMVVLPSHREGLPLSLVEAGAMNLPVIASDVGSVRDLVGEERGWLVPARDEVRLAQAMKEVLENSEEASKRASRLLAHVRQNFGDEENARKVAAIYREIIAAKNQR